MVKNRKTWFTSDTHAFQKNICIPISEWKSGALRDFPNEDIMTEHIANQINTYVKEDDILYHLGDWSFGGLDKILKFRNMINCRTIHLILGNHDSHIGKNDSIITKTGIDEYNEMWELYEKVGKDTFYNSYISKFSPIRFTVSRGVYVNPQDLFTSINTQLEITIKFPEPDPNAKWEKVRLFMSHYAHRVWNHSHKGSIHLYGHSHGNLEPYGKSLDVGIDNIYKLIGEYRPVNVTDIVKLLENTSVKIVDHHEPDR